MDYYLWWITVLLCFLQAERVRLGHSHIYFLLRHFSLCFVTCIHRHNRKAEGLHRSWGTTQQYSEQCSSSSSTLLISFYTYICRTFLPWAFISFTKSRVDYWYFTLYPYAPSSLESTLSPPFPFFANAPLISDAQLGSTLSLGAARGSQVTPGCPWTCAEPSSPHVNSVLINQCCRVLASYAFGCLKHRIWFLIFGLLRPR